MKKKIAVFCAIVMIITCTAQSVGAINVIMNSSFLKFPDQEPVIENGTTLVPIRAVAEGLGLEVTWDDPTDTVVLKKDNFFVELVIGSTAAKTSAGEKTLLVAPKIINGRTMVPLRFIAEEMGLTVLWNDKYQRVIINGQVDTETVVVPAPKEESSEPVEEGTGEVSEGETIVEEVPEEEETEFVEEGNFIVIDSASASLSFELPEVFYDEDVDDEEGFSFRTLDGVDAQHTYNWDVVTRHESYANESKTDGILFVVQEFEPLESEEYSIDEIMEDYPEAPIAPERPQWPDVDFELMASEMQRLLVEQMFIDMGMEVPENAGELSEEEVMEMLGFETEEDYNAQVELSMENVDFYQAPGYDEYMVWQEEQQIYNEENQIYREEMKIYNEEAGRINRAKEYGMRNFQKIAASASDEDWADFFSSGLNTDEEVRYDGVEVLEISGKRIVHATLYAEDPDDEQGVFDFYFFVDGDVRISIYGGTLYGSEPSAMAIDALSQMIVR